MLSEKDRAVVGSYVGAGMNLEVLLKSFPQFQSADVKSVYEEYTRPVINYTDSAQVSKIGRASCRERV